MTAPAGRDPAIVGAAENWIEACRHESWRDRELAARRLADFPAAALFDFFAELVQTTHDFAARNAALVWLERNASDQLFVLHERLREGDSRLHFINLLGRIRDPRSVGMLRRFLDDPDPNIVNAALETLGQIASPLALPWVERLLGHEDPWIAVPAIVAIGAIGDPRSVRKLTPYLQDEFMAPQVLHALSRIGGRDVLRVLVEYWNGPMPPSLLGPYVEALGELWQRSMEQTERIGRELRRHPQIDAPQLWSYVREGNAIAGRGAYWLLMWLEPIQAAEAIGTAASHEDWSGMLREMPSQVSQDIDWLTVVRGSSIATRLVMVDLAARTPHLVAVASELCADSDDAVRLTVVRALAQTIHVPKMLEAAERLLLVMIWDRSPAVRAVARGYFRQKGTRLIEQQAETFFDFGRPEVVREVLDEFPHLATPGLKSKLERVADAHLQRGSTGSAAQLARALGARSWSQKLKGHVTSLGSNDPKMMDFVRAVPQPLDDDSRAWLTDLLPNADTPIRHEILHVLGQDPVARGRVDFWSDWLRVGVERELAAVAVQVLSAQSIDGRTAAMIRDMLPSADVYLRRLLLRVLAQSRQLPPVYMRAALSDPHWAVRLRAVEWVPVADLSVDETERLLADESHVSRLLAFKLRETTAANSAGRAAGRIASEVSTLVRSAGDSTYAAVLEQANQLVLEEWVRARIGISYRDHRLSLFGMRVAPRVQALGLPDVDAYVEYLNFHPHRQVELQSLITRLTNNETYFFRERAQLDVIVQKLIPEILQRRPEVRMASAGCSSGEEAVSLVSLWSHSASADLQRLQVFGLDVDMDILEKARSARYGENSFRGVDPVFRYKFFDGVDGSYVPKPHIRAQTSFRWANLFDGASLGPREAFDIILCRNVLIYFDDAGKRQVARNLYERLRPGGYLIVGLSETLSDISYDLEPRRIQSVLVYYRKE